MYIYKTTNLINGKIYIGLSTKLVEESESYYGSGNSILIAIKKYGKENFKKEILERDIEDRDYLCELEIFYIAKYNSAKRGIGYNLTHGGDGALGLEFTQERRDKISNALTGKKLSPEYYQKTLVAMAKARAAVKNHDITEETKQKIAESIKGRHWYHDPFNPESNGQYHTAPEGWVIGRGKKLYRPSGIEYNIINSRKGTKLSDDVKAKISNALKGNVPGNKGKKLYHNPDTGEQMCFSDNPPVGWVKGIFKPEDFL